MFWCVQVFLRTALKLKLINAKGGTTMLCRDFFSIFGKGALEPFALGIFLHFTRNWENFFDHFYIIFFNRAPKAEFNYSNLSLGVRKNGL